MDLLSWIFCGVITVTTLIIISGYFYTTRKFGYWKNRGVFEVPPTPFVGNCGKYFKHEKSPGALFKKFYDENKNLPYMGFYMVDEPCLLVNDPEIIKQIFIKDFNCFTDKWMRAGKNDSINHSLFFIDNPHWKYLRQKFTNLFTPGKLRSNFDSFAVIGKELNDYLDSLQLEDGGREIDVKELSAKFMTDITGLMFGIKCNSLKNPEAQIRKIGSGMFGNYSIKRAFELSIIFLAPQFADIFGCRFVLENAYKFFKNLFEDVMDERKNSELKGNDFIDLVVQLRESDVISPDGFKLDNDNLASQIIMFFAAGFEPPAVVMAFCLFELAKNQEVQKKLRKQINSALMENEKITYDMVNDLQYLEMIISEILRMYPTMPIMDRKASSDYKIEQTGLVIEKGTPILVPLLGLHYDPQYFPDPYAFKPERFADNKIRNCSYYLPFGLGSRGCIASRQGLMQVKLGLISIISKFEVTLLKKNFIEFDRFSALSSPKDGLPLRIRKLDPNDNTVY